MSDNTVNQLKPYVEFGFNRDADWPTLTINVPTKRDIVAMTVVSLLQSIFGEIEYNVRVRFLIGKSNIDQARSILATYWYDEESNNQHRNPKSAFIFVDADQTFTLDDIKRLTTTKGDVVCGIYANSSGIMACRPLDYNQVVNLGEGELEAGATGFMLFRYDILNRVAEHLGHKRYLVASPFANIIPFFTQTFINHEINEIPVDDWLGEDYGFCHKVRSVGGVIRGFISPTLGHATTFVRTIPVPSFKAMMSERFITYLAPGPVLWNPADDDLGGSELAIRELSKRWAKMEYKVVVYTTVREPMVHDNVMYVPINRVPLDVLHNILICWRRGAVRMLSQIHARRVIVDYHDEITESPMMHSNVINRFMVKSEFHRKQLQSIIDPYMRKLIRVVPNGIDRSLIESPLNIDLSTRAKNKVLYASSYTRGLMVLLTEVMPIVWKKGHQVEVHIYYGRAMLSPEENKKFDELFKHPLVKEHSRVSRDQLFKIRQEFRVHCYPVCNGEIDCMSVRESALAGCVPVVSKNKVFENNERQYVRRVELNNHRAMASEVIKLLTDDQYFTNVQQKVYQKAKDCSLNWDQVSDLWSKELE